MWFVVNEEPPSAGDVRKRVAPRRRRHYNGSRSETQKLIKNMQTKILKAVLIVAFACGALALGACQNRTAETTTAPASTYSK